MHYSPQQQVKKTAVKAKAKKKSKKSQKEGGSPPGPKLETPSPSRAKAVEAALHRQCTSDMTTTAKKVPKEDTEKVATPTPKADPKGKAKAKVNPAKKDPTESSHSGDDSSTEVSDEGGSDQELSLEIVRARKAAHARYMRFSRSMKSRRALSIFIL